MRKVRRALDIVWEGRRWEDVVKAQEERAGEGAGAAGARWVPAFVSVSAARDTDTGSLLLASADFGR